MSLGDGIRLVEKQERERCTALNAIKREKCKEEMKRPSTFGGNTKKSHIEISPIREVNKF